MTNLEAIKGLVGYPLSDNAYTLALLNRGLTSTDEYSIGNKQQLELSQADLIFTLVSYPNVTEGGYSVSLSDKKTLISLANGIYTRYLQTSPFKPTARFVQRW